MMHCSLEVTEFCATKSKTIVFFLFVCFKENHETKDLPDRSVGKESACNAGDPGSIPGSRRSPGEGKGYLLQYSGLENCPRGFRVRHN